MLLGLLSRVVAKGDLTVIAPNGRSHRFGDGTNPKSIIEISDWGTFLRLSLKPQLAIGEAYMDGRLIIREGGIAGLLEVLLLNLGTGTAGGLAGAVDGLRRFVRRLQQFNPMTRARRNVAHHYDLSGAMYDLFLDADRQYSCAYYETPGMTLEDAQAAKKRHIAAKLALKPGMRVLDIGCGWGGLALYLAELGAASVKGITLSQEQLAHARGRAQAARQSGRVAFALEDYRKTQGTDSRHFGCTTPRLSRSGARGSLRTGRKRRNSMTNGSAACGSSISRARRWASAIRASSCFSCSSPSGSTRCP